MLKPNKGSLAKELQNNVQAACLLKDGMALVQRLKGDQKAFTEIAESLLSMALNESTSSDRMDVISNDHLDDSIKSKERENRGKGSGSEFHNLQAEQLVKQWRKFLYSSREQAGIDSLYDQGMAEEKVC